MIGKTNAISGVSAPVPKIKTVSGSVISISDALAQAAVSLVADINAVQSGSGDPSPSNVRPISGLDAVKVTRTGKNLIDDSKRYIAADTTVYVGAESNAYTVALPAGTYTISVDFGAETYGMFYREANDSANTSLWNSGSGTTEKTFTIEEGIYRFWVYRNAASGGVDPTKIIHVQIELGSTATAYEPYDGDTYTIQLGQTVYGGSLDVTTGVLTVDKAYLNLNTANMNNNEDYPAWKSSGVREIVGGGLNGGLYNALTNISPIISSGQWAIGVNTNGTNDTLILNKPYFNKTQTEWQALAMDIQFVIPFATPQTFQLSPTTVRMLVGNNTLWANSGDSELQYWARR